ncbi:MAG TPA: replication-associated recombination protein A [Candidatus Limnocylindrales bacterium]|jgi:putative ATPase|nr:replication-associated recombination protein A [Candidatus Limnocylindrales bacterium]
MPSTRRPVGARPEALFQPPPERQPLAARMRPRNLDEFVGQDHLVGERGPLRRSIARGHLASLLLWGPPGTGKTSLARLLAGEVGANFSTMSAVMAGVADVRSTIAEAQDRLALHGTRTVLFLDEIHRFNKAQQDALLPHVEDGTITLIGATTENPYFEVNSALLSRMRVWRLEALTDEEVGTIVRRALEDEERGLAGSLGPEGGVALGQDAFDHLVGLAGGDARAALNVLEGAVALAEGEDVRDEAGKVAPRLEDVEAAAQQRVLAYDRAGDGHYDTVSAFIKSLRGNDPDAALYWLASMVAAGEDPRFIARRLIISASEDVGNADPRALQVAVAAAQALDHVGLPEAQYALAQATTYIATAPKSNRSGSAYWAAVGDVEAHGSLAVPLHLRQAPHRLMRQHGIGVGYQYPHDFEEADVDQQYLPDELTDRRYYMPIEQGYEATIANRMTERSEKRGAGKPKRSTAPKPQIAKGAGTNLMRTRETNRKKLAETEKRDAAVD